MAKVSILMNCYNGEKYLKEALDSVVGQSYTDWELVFWDNQSTDASAEIAKSYNDERIKYFYAPSHTPLGEARNLALSECGGEYLAFLDTDDIWAPSKLEKQLAIMDTNADFALCYGDFEKIDEDGRHISHYATRHKNGYIFDSLLSWYEIGMPTALIRTSSLREAPPPYFDISLSFSPDYDLFMRIAATHKVCSLKEPIAKYRVVTNSLTNKTKARHSRELIYSLIKLEGLYPKLYDKDKDEFDIAYRWAAILEANYLLSIGKVAEARGCLKKARTAGRKHFWKYIISFLPTQLAIVIYKKWFY
jgi:glycosyltransferase involved in cell wall biosynthesis